MTTIQEVNYHRPVLIGTQRWVSVSGVILLVFLNTVQLALGANLAVLAFASAGAIVVLGYLVARPADLGSLFVAFVFFQLFGLAWFYKSLCLIPLDEGLLKPVPSMIWGFFIVLAAGTAAFASRILQGTGYALSRFYDKFRFWGVLGWIFVCLGQLARYGGHSHSIGVDSIPGGGSGLFGPFQKFDILGTSLLACSAAKRGRAFDISLAAVLVLAVIDAMVFNIKSALIYRPAAILLAVLVGPVSLRRKISLVAMGGLAFLAADLFLFPVIQALRWNVRESASLAERLELTLAAVKRGELKGYKQVQTSDHLVDQYLNFIPSDSAVISRFASLGYLDLTLDFAKPATASREMGAFLERALAKALPSFLSPGKDLIPLGDYLWHDIDPTIVLDSHVVIGPFASARLVFGEVQGFLLVTGVWIISLWLFRRFYGGDLRHPFVQFLLVNVLVTLVEGDVEVITSSLFRGFWQDVAIVATVGWVVTCYAPAWLPNSRVR
jgi:hypothetical protein